jgi:type I restriction enzyme S subunit
MSKNSFSKYRLHECAHDVVDNRGKNPPGGYFSEGEYPILDNYLIQNTLYPDLKKVKRYINQETHDNFLRGYLEKDDVIVTLVGNGICNASLSPSSNVVIIQNTIGIKTNEKLVNKFLYYYFLHNQKALVKLDRGSSQPSVNKNDLLDFEIEIPDISTQQKIAAVLSALDAKIELNQRINAELESMAKTLYDYWFVQFDFPNEKGKPYKSAGGEMVWNDELKREIPLGWEVVELSDIANITMGQSPPGESYNEDGEGKIFFQGCTDFGNRFPSVRQFTTQPTRFAKEGDILLSVRAPVGTINIAKEDCCIGRGLAALNSKDNTITYLLEVMRNLKQVFDRRNVNGTTFGSITKDDLFSLKVLKPSKDILEQYQKIIYPTFEMQNKLELESQTLTELRDWLLPMLMNGQIQVQT